MAPTKRAAGDDGAAPPPGRRLRATVPLAPSSSISNPAPPQSPRKRFRAVALVVLCFKRPKDRSTDDCFVPISPLQIGRLVKELGHISHRLGTIAQQLQSFMEPTHVPSLEVSDVTRPSPNGHNRKRVEQDTNQEGTSAGGLVTRQHEGKDTRIRLRFLSELKSPVYHDDAIKSIRLGIFDGDTIIKSGPYSELKVEVLALEGSFPYDAKGSWTPEEFHKHRACCRDGEGNVLAGKGTKAQLTNGECYFHSIKFKEGSCRARNQTFIIGARVCDGQALDRPVQGAVMTPMVVHDRRNKYNEKSHPPNLDDEVCCLEQISRIGKYYERLTRNNICTVEHFLKALYKDEDKLAKILEINKKWKGWDKMVNHAQQCSLKGKPELKSYRCEKENVVLFFNCVHRLVGAKFGGRYIASDKFEPDQQNLVNKLKKTAYDQWDVLAEDHVMKDNIPIPITTDAHAGAGPSCMPSVTQQNSYGHHFAVHQVGGIPATEVLSLHALGPRSSISDPHSTHNHQVGGIPIAERLAHGLNESPFQIANYGPSPSFSVPNQGAEAASQEQHFSDDLNDLELLFEEDLPFGLPFHGEGDGSALLQPQADTNNWAAVPSGLYQGDMESLGGWSGHGNGTLEALVSAHVYVVPEQRQLGAPGSGQGSMQNQTPSLPTIAPESRWSRLNKLFHLINGRKTCPGTGHTDG